MIVEWQEEHALRERLGALGLTVRVDAPSRDSDDPWWSAELTIGSVHVMDASPSGERLALWGAADSLPEPLRSRALTVLGGEGA